MTAYPTKWTAWDARLIALASQRFSATEIARTLTAEGFSCTKNSILGRARRISLATLIPGGNAKIGRILPPRPAPIIAPATSSGHVHWPEKETGCRWPLWPDSGPNGPMRFCGEPSTLGAPYCGAHAKRAYSPRVEPLSGVRR